MTVSYESKAAAEQQQKEAAQREARNREVFDEVLARYPLKDHEANFRLFVDWSGDGLTLEKAEYLLKHRVAGFNPDVVTREQLISELAEELREGCSTRTLSDYDFRQKVLRIGTWSLRQLREERRSMRLRRELTTAQAARNYLTEVRSEGTENKYPGWPRMLKTVVPRGEIFSRNFDATYIKSLDAFELKRLIAVYGLAQVNDRIAGRS